MSSKSWISFLSCSGSDFFHIRRLPKRIVRCQICLWWILFLQKIYCTKSISKKIFMYFLNLFMIWSLLCFYLHFCNTIIVHGAINYSFWANGEQIFNILVIYCNLMIQRMKNCMKQSWNIVDLVMKRQFISRFSTTQILSCRSLGLSTGQAQHIIVITYLWKEVYPQSALLTQG